MQTYLSYFFVVLPLTCPVIFIKSFLFPETSIFMCKMMFSKSPLIVFCDIFVSIICRALVITDIYSKITYIFSDTLQSIKTDIQWVSGNLIIIELSINRTYTTCQHPLKQSTTSLSILNLSKQLEGHRASAAYWTLTPCGPWNQEHTKADCSILPLPLLGGIIPLFLLERKGTMVNSFH